MMSVLFLCQANLCRSPMAAALLKRRLTETGISAVITSAGTSALGTPPDRATVQVMAARRIDISGHFGRQVTRHDLIAADLVIAMSRDNLRHAVVLEPRAWARTFTFKELVRRARAQPPRGGAEPAADWLARISQDREHASMLGSNDADDVADPTGRPVSAYEVTAELLADLAAELVACCWGGTVSLPRHAGLSAETDKSGRRFA